MREFITTVLVILGILFLIGSCEDCSGGCDLNDGCASSCSSCASACEKQYKGEITLNIHKYDESILTIKGQRERGKKNCIINNSGDYETFGTYSVPKRVGFTFDGLVYYDEDGYSKELLSYGKYINYSNLWKIKDKKVIEVYEKWNPIEYRVTYVTNQGLNSSYYTDYYYSIGEEIEFTQLIDNVFKRDYDERKQINGYVAYFENVNGEFVEFPWSFNQTFDENIANCYEDVRFGELRIFVKANWLADKVKVELNFNYSDGNDNVVAPKILVVGYDEDLSKYFSEYVSAPNRQFMGWYVDEELTAKAPKQISKNYETTPLKLYAKHLEFKTIYIDLQDGKGAKDARAFEDGTFLIKDSNGAYTIEIPEQKDGAFLYGLSLSIGGQVVRDYEKILENATYYTRYELLP